MKLYIREKVEKSVDDEELITLEVYKTPNVIHSLMLFLQMKGNRNPFSILAEIHTNRQSNGGTNLANKYGDLRWKWLHERGFNVLADKHQYAYMQSLWASPEIVQGVFCESPAGTGKTVLAVLAGAYAIENQEYDRIIYIRNPQVVGKDIGFLPGEKDEKTGPFMQPFIKALDYVKPGTFEQWAAQEKAFAITPTFERGVTYDRAYIIVDEAQSISLGELQTIYTRVTDSCKVVTTGSLLQIDDPKLKRFAGFTPFEVYMKHFEGQQVTFHKLVTNYRGWFSNHSDNVRETVEKLESLQGR